MSARIDLIPSPFDRLDPIARAVRWWTSQMIDIFGVAMRKQIAADALDRGERPRGSHLLVTLPETEAFIAKLTLPKGRSDAHASAIKLRLADLAPTDPALLQISATAIEQADDGAITYAVAMARRERLDALEISARRKGARTVRYQTEDCSAAELRSGKAERADRRALIVNASMVGALLIAAVAAVATWTARVEDETRALGQHERSLRRAVVTTEAARRDADVARDLISRGVLERRAGATLETLSALNNATPDGAWWTAIRWSPEEITISAQAGDATKAIAAISANAKAWVVELGGSINANDGAGAQAFELRLRPREAKAP